MDSLDELGPLYGVDDFLGEEATDLTVQEVPRFATKNDGGRRQVKLVAEAAKNPAGEQDSPYLRGAAIYAKRYGSLADEARRWRLACLAAFAVAAIAIGGIVAIARQVKVVPYVVEVDEHGFTVPVELAEEASATDQRVIISSVAKWFRAHRTVVGDPQAQRDLIDQTYAMLSEGTPAHAAASAWYAANNPFTRAQERVAVEVDRVQPMGDARSLTVEWTEVVSVGASRREERYSAFVTVELSPTRVLEEVIANPLGVYIKEFSVSRLQ